MNSRLPTLSRGLPWLLALLAVALVFALVTQRERAIDHAIHALPDLERAALYQRTLETLQSTCGHLQGPEFSDFCRQQAALIVHFSQCDAACQALAHRFDSLPTR